jgi:hypothetical protein
MCILASLLHAIHSCFLSSYVIVLFGVLYFLVATFIAAIAFVTFVLDQLCLQFRNFCCKLLQFYVIGI